jgi:hypothetical protein
MMTERRYDITKPITDPYDHVVRGWGEWYELCSLNCARSALHETFGSGVMVVSTEPIGFPVDNPPWACLPKPGDSEFRYGPVKFGIVMSIFAVLVILEPFWRWLGFKPHLYYRWERN